MLELHLKDDQYTYSFTDHQRQIARGIVFDKDCNFYFVRVNRDDDFGKMTLIETSGGGVEEGESLEEAVTRELKEELGVIVKVIDQIAVVTDYYNLIHRENINHYFLCKIVEFGDTEMTKEEKEDFKLSTLKLRYDEAMSEYERLNNSKLGQLIYNREKPVLEYAHHYIKNNL